MLPRDMKHLAPLLVLLACPFLGQGGRAEAGFTVGQLQVVTQGDSNALSFELTPALGGEPRQDTSSAERSAPRFDWPLEKSPGNNGPEACEGMSSAPSAGPSAPGGMPLAASVDKEPPEGTATGRLFLCNERFKPPPFASRWFRPPR